MIQRALRDFSLSIAIGLSLLLTADAFIWFAQWRFHVAPDAQELRGIAVAKVAALAGPLFLMGIAIVNVRFPLAVGYRNWLTATPWRAGVPLPLGPVYINVTDLVVVLGFALVALWDGTCSPVLLIFAFLVGYVLAAIFVLMKVGPMAIGVALLVILGEMVRVAPDWRWLLALAVGMYVLASWALRQSLRAFPWGRDKLEAPAVSLGGGFERLGPKSVDEPISMTRAVVSTMLVGWIIFCVFPRLDDGKSETPFIAALLVGVVGCLAAMFRGIAYTAAHQSPISLWGRIWTRHWIVPGYDYVMLAPIAVALCAMTIPMALILSGIPGAPAIGISGAVTLLALMKLPPTMRCWRLTGHHRIVTASVNRQKEIVTP